MIRNDVIFQQKKDKKKKRKKERNDVNLKMVKINHIQMLLKITLDSTNS